MLKSRIAATIGLTLAAVGLSLAASTPAQAVWVWQLYGNYPTLQECNSVGFELEQEPDIGIHQCRRTVSGTFDLYISVFR
jgi:hypothetical protein